MKSQITRITAYLFSILVLVVSCDHSPNGSNLGTKSGQSSPDLPTKPLVVWDCPIGGVMKQGVLDEMTVLNAPEWDTVSPVILSIQKALEISHRVFETQGTREWRKDWKLNNVTLGELTQYPNKWTYEIEYKPNHTISGLDVTVTVFVFLDGSSSSIRDKVTGGTR